MPKMNRNPYFTPQGGGRIGQHGHGQQCGDCWGEESIRGLNGNEKKYYKF